VRITCTMYKRRGMSSILGTLIFVGILFTAVIPMYLTMNQADVIFEQEKHEIGIIDEEKEREEMSFYVYPDTNDDLIVVVQNNCPVPVKVVRVWINNTLYDTSTELDPLEGGIEIGPYDVPLIAGAMYNIRITSERGNFFDSSSGDLEYDGIDWIVETKLINVVVSASGTIFKVYLYKWEDPGGGLQWVYKDWAQVWKIGGSAFKPFEVSAYGNGEYRVVVKRGSNIIHDEDGLMMEWPEGPSTLWVYA
jgi:flagellin-like protein